ncbi:MAG TPA: DOPA 4,5-dioxygenase family protein [Chloroflexota bacterium]|jgi:aromatic ring-cleaving dioxygenase|nr:DOPA 4,5-dioxygenase family protein [Chloroflexota bacterium]
MTGTPHTQGAEDRAPAAQPSAAPEAPATPGAVEASYEALDESLAEDFHFHLYFDAETRDSALAIRSQLVQTAPFRYQLPPVREAPMGPHRWPIWSVWVDRANFTPAVEWMMRHHGHHSVLIHPNIDDGLQDHTDHAMWLGTPLPLKLEVFDPPPSG